MFLDHVAGRGSLTGDTAADELTLTTTAAIAVGEVAVLRLSLTTDAILASADSSHVDTVVDSAGNEWHKIGERTRAGENPSTFVKATIVAMWYSHLTTALPSGGTITAAFDAQYRAYCMAVDAFEMEVPESTVSIAGVGTASGASNPTTVSVTCTPAAGGEDYTWLFAIATNANPGDALNLSGSYVTDRPKVTSAPSSFRRTVLAGQYRQLNADTQTWTGSVTGSGVLWATVLGALLITLPTPPEPPEGTREFQQDFETESHQTDRTSTSARPDGVVPDYLVATSLGPERVGLPGGNVHSHMWKVRAEPGSVYMARETQTQDDWEPEELLFTYMGVDIDEITLAFDVTGYPVVGMQRATQVGGGPTVSVRYWTGTAYSEKVFGAGRTPRAVTDWFPTRVAGNVCPPDVDVQVFWLKDGQGMQRRSSADVYNADNATPLTSSSWNRLHQAFRTEDRRVSVMYSQRNVVTGRYLFRRVDSKVYPDSKLRRPLFIATNGLGTDLFVNGGEAWRGAPATQDWYLRCQTQDAADAIEVGASIYYPSGNNPPFDQQEQELTVVNAGDFDDAVFSITHGGGAMSLTAFRARARRTVAGVTCYSPWRYMLVPAEWGPGLTPADFLTTCDRDSMIDVDARMHWLMDGLVEGSRLTAESARNDYSPCGSTPVITAEDTGPGSAYPGYWFAGGVRNTGPSFPFPTHVQNWAIRRRPFARVDFTADGVRYTGRMVGNVIGTAGAGVAPAFTWPETRFPSQFPDDTGAFPAEPVTLQIIRTT